ncbi:MAG TPA: hydroxymethylglutaryl-CoA lyase, partial [Fimbriimonas sp.]
ARGGGVSMVRIVEVGPRDGLQNEKTPIPTEDKLRFVQNLVDAGLREIEATSFVSPKAVPQLSDADEIWKRLPAGPAYSALVPNLRGLDRAVSAGVDRIAVFTGASEAFVQRNIGMSVQESLQVFAEVIERFRERVPTGWVRGYVSTSFECPYAGRVLHDAVVDVADRLVSIGCSEICIGDTIGVAVPSEVRTLARALRDRFRGGPLDFLSWHFHDTRGTAIANVAAVMEEVPEACSFDSSAGGLGGCPYAPGAGGNLATEDLAYFLDRSGVPSGVRLDRLARASLEVLGTLGRAPSSKAQLALLAEEPSSPR